MDHCGTIATNRFMPDITVSEVVTGLNHVPVFSFPHLTTQPVNAYHEGIEELCFPFLYLYGCNSLNQKRQVQVSVLKHFQTRILSADSR